MFIRRLLLSIALVLAPHFALAQSAILQGGPWTPGHAPMYVGQGYSQTIVQDSGAAKGGAVGLGLSELLLQQRGTGTPPYANVGTGPYYTNSCDYDAPITSAGGYHYLCFGPNSSGGGMIAYGAVGAASPLPLYFVLNGVTYQFPGGGAGSGNVVGPNSSTQNDIATFNNTAGTLLKDSGISLASQSANLFLGTPSGGSGVPSFRGIASADLTTALASPPAIGGSAPAAITGTQLTSTITTGTPPLVVASATNVPNLNASSLSGATFAAPGPIGSVTPAAGSFSSVTGGTGSFTTLAASSTVSGAGITALFASPPPIGVSAAAAGAFTTLSASSTVSGTGFSTYLASPPAIGGTAPAAGKFTTLTETNLLVSNAAPTVSSGFGSGASISANNGTAAFRVNVGTSSGNTGVIGLPTAANGWNCYGTDLSTRSTSVFLTEQTASSASSATLGNFGDTNTAGPWTNNDILAVSCFAY